MFNFMETGPIQPMLSLPDLPAFPTGKPLLTGMRTLTIRASLLLDRADIKFSATSKATEPRVCQIIYIGDVDSYTNINHQGDGVTDDTAAINAAISAGGRCGQGCASTTTTPAVVYFPAGTYVISSSILDYYYTQLIGNPNDLPVLQATPNFSGFGIIDGDHYYTSNLNWLSTNVFYRQVRNFVIDMTQIPSGSSATGIHWPTAQATSIQNVVFQMSQASGTQHVGLFIESGTSFPYHNIIDFQQINFRFRRLHDRFDV
jgi:hypothetical protein